MTLDPINPPGGPQPGRHQLDPAHRSGTPETPGHTRAGKPAEPLAADAAELSGEVRALAGQEAVPSGELTPERLREILGRLARGEYDDPAVLDATARGLGNDLSVAPED